MLEHENRLIEQQVARGFRWLRFDAPLEQAFRHYLFDTGRWLRFFLLCSSLLVLVLVTLFDHALLNTPPRLDAVAHPLQRWVTLPALIVALLLTLRPGHRQKSDISLVITAILLVASVLIQRAVGARYGFDVPIEFIATTIAAIFFLGRLPFRRFFLFALVLTLVMLWVEYAFVEPERDGWYRVGVACMMVLLSCVGGYFFEYVMRDAWLQRKLLENLATRDPLTGLANRRAFNLLAERALRTARRDREPLTLAILDVDAFKPFNDIYGHTAGDNCLRRIARTIDAVPRRPLDVCGRYGGEEFIIALHGAGEADAAAMFQTLCSNIEQLHIPNSGSTNAAFVTASIGLAVADDPSIVSMQELIELADEALYRAKSRGRNQLCIADTPTAAATAPLRVVSKASRGSLN